LCVNYINPLLRAKFRKGRGYRADGLSVNIRNIPEFSGRLARARSRSSIPDIPGIEKSTLSTSIAGFASGAALPLEASISTIRYRATASRFISRTLSLSSTSKGWTNSIVFLYITSSRPAMTGTDPANYAGALRAHVGGSRALIG